MHRDGPMLLLGSMAGSCGGKGRGFAPASASRKPIMNNYEFKIAVPFGYCAVPGDLFHDQLRQVLPSIH